MSEPTTYSLVTGVAAALRERIAPAVSGAWEASELRSIDAVLAVVANRLEHEDDVVAEDNAELRTLLRSLAESGVTVEDVGDEGDARTCNTRLRSALEGCMDQLHDRRHADEIAALRRYLVAATERDQRIYGPLGSMRAF